MAIYDPKQIEEIVDYRVKQEMNKFIDKLHKCITMESVNEVNNYIYGIIKEYEGKEEC